MYWHKISETKPIRNILEVKKIHKLNNLFYFYFIIVCFPYLRYLLIFYQIHFIFVVKRSEFNFSSHFCHQPFLFFYLILFFFYFLVTHKSIILNIISFISFYLFVRLLLSCHRENIIFFYLLLSYYKSNSFALKVHFQKKKTQLKS